MNEYDAKFLREAQTHPTHWVIYPIRVGNVFTRRYKLVYIGPGPTQTPRRRPSVGTPTDVPYLSVVK